MINDFKKYRDFYPIYIYICMYIYLISNGFFIIISVIKEISKYTVIYIYNFNFKVNR